ncbi:hypothetical protein [Flavobacterium alkalisoli]|uniref:hypothetical protein n=1 Tax=Flavobacterium alkalisoli TaxID=2602769 RepID=UPI003A8D3C17
MKKLLMLLFAGLSFISCEQMLKDRGGDAEVEPEKKVVLGNDKDAKGCVTSAGYRWSLLNKECIRVFEDGYRLNPLNELKETGTSLSAFIIFNDDKSVAELFLPDSSKSYLLSKQEDGIYKSDEWELEVNKDYTLSKEGVALYAGALIEEHRVTGDDNEQS